MALLLVAVVGRFSCLKTATYKRRRLYTTHQVSACRHMRAYTRYKHLPLHTCTSCGPQGSRSQGRPDFRTQGPLDEFFEAKATYHEPGPRASPLFVRMESGQAVFCAPGGHAAKPACCRLRLDVCLATVIVFTHYSMT